MSGQELAHPVEPEVNVVDLIIRYENGELSDADTLVLFSRLIKSGQAWTLQGFYGRAARQLIEQGFISEAGDIIVQEPAMGELQDLGPDAPAGAGDDVEAYRG